MVNKRAWSTQEDQKLKDYMHKHGEGSWKSIPKAAGLLRCGKSCRLRWINYLRPDLKRGGFSEDEEDLMVRLHALLGNRWSLIAGRLPGRTNNEVKNYWNSHLGKKLINLGIDPRNHRLGHGNRLFVAAQRSIVVSSSSSTSGTQLPRTDKDRNDEDVLMVKSVRDSSLPELNLDRTLRVPSPSNGGEDKP